MTLFRSAAFADATRHAATSATFVSPVEKRLPEERGDESARYGGGREGSIAERAVTPDTYESIVVCPITRGRHVSSCRFTRRLPSPDGAVAVCPRLEQSFLRFPCNPLAVCPPFRMRHRVSSWEVCAEFSQSARLAGLKSRFVKGFRLKQLCRF
jgi:hypothetical protein